MIHVVEITNPWNPHQDCRKTELESGKTIREYLEILRPGFVEFSLPTICILDGIPKLRKSWLTDKLKDGQVLVFHTQPEGGISSVVGIVVMLLASFLGSTDTPVAQPPSVSETPEADPVYSLSGRRNKNRLSTPIEVAYGRTRMWPAFAAAPFTQYSGNDQFLYQLFCLGQGFFTINETFIEDTPIDQFQEITLEYSPPGTSVTLFPDNVETSTEVGSLELLAPNEGGGLVGPFVANTAFTLANILEVDVFLPKGLYFSEDDGSLSSLTITALFERQEIDDLGDPIGGWVTLVNFSKTLNTNTPQRFTLSAAVTPGRYQVRARRTDNKNESHRSGHKIIWERMRAFLPSTKDYGNVTMLAVRARSSNNLNNQSKNRINVDATRELVSWDKPSQTFNARAPTSSIVWAFYDVFTAIYGGQLDDSFIDLDGLYDLDQIYIARNNFFNWVFDKKTTVWNAARTIAGVGRGKPVLNGSQVTLIRDRIRTLSSAVFLPDNIIQGSFKWEVSLFNVDEHNGVEVEYIDPITWKPETVPCLLPGDTNTNPAHVRMAGITDRQHAFEEGMYLRSKNVKLREGYVFKTGLEGQIPAYSDLISFSHDVPRFSDSGHLISKVGLVLTLSKKVVFTPSVTHKILFRKKDGSADGPFTVVETADPKVVNLLSEPGSDFYFDANREPMYFLFGEENIVSRDAVVERISPSESDAVELELINYDPSIFAFDGVDAPPLSDPTEPPPVPSLPVVEGATLEPIVNNLNQVNFNWIPAVGANRYSVERSIDGINWIGVSTIITTSIILNVEAPGTLFARVAGINEGIGPFDETSAVVGVATTIPNNPTNLQLAAEFVGTSVSIVWSAASLATAYTVRVYDGDPTLTATTLLRTTDTSITSFVYTSQNMLNDGVRIRDIWFEVAAINALGESDDPPTLETNNPIASTPANPASVLETNNAPIDITYRVSWDQVQETDVVNYRVYGSDVMGFTPGPSNLITAGFVLSLLVTVNLTTAGTHPTFYWRVVSEDVWGDELDNITAEQTIAAFP